MTAGKENLLLRSLAIAGGLTLFKLGLFAVTNSVAILASAADSLMDLLVSLANFILNKFSSKPADQNHPYGHGKIESLAGLIQSLIIGGTVIGVAALSINRLRAPEPIVQPLAGIVVTTLALLLNGWHTRNLKKSMVATNSQIIATEYLHYATDTFLYLGVLVSFVLTYLTGHASWDPVISLLIVLYLLKNVAGLFLETLSELLDTQLSGELLKEIDITIHSFSPKIVGYHDLRTRKVGPTKFIEFHVALRNVQTFHEAHQLTVGLMDTFQKKYPGAVVTVHADPENPL